MIIFSWKNGKINLEIWKTSIIKIFFSLFIQLHIAKIPIGSGENFPDPDPTRKVRIRNPGFRSDRIRGTVGVCIQNIMTLCFFCWCIVIANYPYPVVFRCALCLTPGPAIPTVGPTASTVWAMWWGASRSSTTTNPSRFSSTSPSKNPLDTGTVLKQISFF